MGKTLAFMGVCVVLAGCMATVPIQSVTGAGVSPQGTAFFIETRSNGLGEYLLICREIAGGQGDCRRTELPQPTTRRMP